MFELLWTPGATEMAKYELPSITIETRGERATGLHDDETREDVHVAAETVGLLVGVPLAIYAAASDRLPLWARVGFGVGGTVMGVVDVALLKTYIEKRRRRR